MILMRCSPYCRPVPRRRTTLVERRLWQIETYVSEMTLKFITGAEPLSNFDIFHETVKSMGVDEAIALTQKAYDAHMSK